jgi:hypothetical protein
MIDKIILSVVLGAVGFNGLYPEPPVPLTVQQKAKQASISNMCNKNPKSKTAKKLCEKWRKHNAKT